MSVISREPIPARRPLSDMTAPCTLFILGASLNLSSSPKSLSQNIRPAIDCSTASVHTCPEALRTSIFLLTDIGASFRYKSVQKCLFASSDILGDCGIFSSIHLRCFLTTFDRDASLAAISAQRSLRCRAGHGMRVDATTVTTLARKVTPNRVLTKERRCRVDIRRRGGMSQALPIPLSTRQ